MHVTHFIPFQWTSNCTTVRKATPNQRFPANNRPNRQQRTPGGHCHPSSSGSVTATLAAAGGSTAVTRQFYRPSRSGSHHQQETTVAGERFSVPFQLFVFSKSGCAFFGVHVDCETVEMQSECVEWGVAGGVVVFE